MSCAIRQRCWCCRSGMTASTPAVSRAARAVASYDLMMRSAVAGRYTNTHRSRGTAAACTREQPLVITYISRRGALNFSAVSAVAWVLGGGSAQARGFDAYIKKKEVEPLDTYIPPVLAARGQLVESLELLDDAANAETARQMLRKGPFSGLRDNIRVVGLNASTLGRQDSGEVVSGFFSALQAYDAALFRTARSDGGPYPDDIRQTAESAVAALDRVLDMVPEDMLAQSRRVLEALADDGAAADGTDTSSQQNLNLLF